MDFDWVGNGKKEKGFEILVLGFRREDLIWKIRDLPLDIVTIKL